jgi:NAD(P)-dependent dehydrogenase (short-subunit alcohol dehydrogenase family)
MSRFLITGASSGIGHQVWEWLDPHGTEGLGFDVHRLGRTDCDFNDAGAVTQALRALAQAHGPLDGIFHAAGVALVSPLRMTTDLNWSESMMAATSAFGILRAVASKGVMNDGGSVVLMSSVAAQRGAPGMAAYSAGKGAVDALTRSAAIELAPRGIRVNAIAAGAVRTPMHDRITARMTQGAQDAYVAAHPLGFGSAEVVAREAIRLLTDAPWTTGTVVVLDGGFLAK